MGGIGSNPIWILPLTFHLLFSCNSGPNPGLENNIIDLAHLHCQASQLKDARFNLADSIRFLQDSILKLQQLSNSDTSVWKIELERMEKSKIELANKSRYLGDSIRQALLHLTENMTLEEKRIFNDNLKTETEKLNCH